MNDILFIITGSIAASRCKEIITLLRKKEVKISCILTKEAKKYIKISDIKKLLKNKIFTDEDEKKNKMLHINLSRDNDMIVVCPATANSIAKLANGYGDNLSSNTLLASSKKILFVPAMNSFMWHNKINQKNVRFLKDNGHEFIGPEVGNLKCGEFGLGRIDNSKNIVSKILSRLENINLLKDSMNPFFDTMPNKSISLINLNSIKDFENLSNHQVEHERFRGNIYVEDLDKWEERKLVGKVLSISDIKFKVIKEIPRCSATNIKPKTSDINLNIPFNLKKIYNHINLGIYLDPLNDGKINKGDLIKINE